MKMLNGCLFLRRLWSCVILTALEGAEEIAYSAIVDGLDDGSELDRQVLEMMEKHPEIASNLPLKNLGPHILNQASILRKELPVVCINGLHK